eukprot:CAMPEP_0183367402 /NCGR_PEP_ID=MMETSP0164_2-20130417/92397_1 /TAXON_ID=221442 /ORGANISM="Coccolithus pelagicus ssp braarudi, Strain PLY182g" /LENGTH=75 /DNA_ID=CAMNT_0025543333 /DNA_START=377 /DNA_END=601 /DNA_ORIENTATION=+
MWTEGVTQKKRHGWHAPEKSSRRSPNHAVLEYQGAAPKWNVYCWSRVICRHGCMAETCAALLKVQPGVGPVGAAA